jgi:hypothetical protein
MQPTVNQSQYVDGTTPGMRNPRVFVSEEGMYIQPDIHVAEMGKGSRIEESKKGICQLRNGQDYQSFTDWLGRNRNTIITVLVIYGGYRLLRR